MNQPYDPIPDAYGYRLSNPPILQIASLLASVNIFERVTMPVLREKSVLLTGYLELLLLAEFQQGDVRIITPHEHNERGCQLSLFWNLDIGDAFELLSQQGVIVDVRKPNVTRISPVPLYNSFMDVWRLVEVLKDVVAKLKQQPAKK